MKEAQAFRDGNVLMINDQPMVIVKAEYNKSGRNTAVVKMRLKNLLNSTATEQVFKADEKFEQVILERKECTYSYVSDDMYVFMDDEYNQYEISAEDLGDTTYFIEDGMEETVEVTFYEGKPISLELPTTIIREVAYTEPAARGDTSGKVTKVARLHTGFELQVAAFIEIGDKIEIDSRTKEFKKRA